MDTQTIKSTLISSAKEDTQKQKEKLREITGRDQ
jgi:hypothetical protein